MIDRLLFLDIDGVLNNRQTTERQPKCAALIGIDPANVVHLNEALDVVGGAHIVISSAWRKTNALTEIARQLRTAGLLYGEIRSMTGSAPGDVQTSSARRTREIADWYRAAPMVNGLTRVCAIDDLPLGSFCFNWQVQTVESEGLTAAHVPMIVKMLSPM